MLKFQKDSKIKIAKKEYVISELLTTLINYPADKTVEFFSGINLSFPRLLRTGVLREVLRPEVLNTRIERASLADEMNYRLSWFNQFTEVQLNNLFKFYNNPVLEKKYLEELWIEIINYITDKSIAETDFEKLILSSVDYSKKQGVKIPSALDFNNNINSLFYDEKGHIDGLKQEVIRPVLYKSSTITEIRELGLKYQVNVPKRLKKSELMAIVIDELKDRGEYTEDKETDLLNMSILVLQRYAITNGIKASTELKKEEVIEYILANAESTKETYFIPSTSVYEIEAHEVGEAMPEVEVTPVVEKEAVVEPVIEEEPVVEVKVETIVEEKAEVEEVAPVIEEEKLEELLKVQPVAQKVVTQTVVNHVNEKESFDFANIEETHLNVVQYHGHKSKRFANKLNNLEEDVKVDNQNEKIIKVDLVKADTKKTKFTLGKFLLRLLLNILIIIAIILIVFVIYAGITYKQAPTMMQGFENWIADIYNKIFSANKYPIQGIRNFLIKLLNLKK